MVVGTSGWSYDHWDGVLYPPGRRPGRLDVYTREFGTVELNASFYRWPRDATFAGWRRRLPAGFLMSVKAPRGLTHAKRLYARRRGSNAITRCWHELGDRRGVLLVQLHPAHERDDARLDYFLGAAAALDAGGGRVPPPQLARRRRSSPCSSGTAPPMRDERRRAAVRPARDRAVRLRAAARPRPRPPLRRLLLRRRPALVGRPDPRVGAAGRDVYVYFNNDGGGNAVRNARRLRELLSGRHP